MVIVAAINVSGDPSVGFFADLVDHIVLVATAGQHGQAAFEQVIARLGLNPQKVRGAVLTERRGIAAMATPGFHTPAAAAARPAVDLDTLVRSVLFLAAFMAAWISFHPFADLSQPPDAVVAGGDIVNQLAFSAMFIAFAAWTFCHQPRRLTLLLRPVLILTVLWCLVSVIASWEPSLAARRLAFALVVMSISAMLLLLPKNLRHFSDLMAAAALIVLAACYLGVVLLPQYAIHHATDFLEPEHAGNWRGVFPHKNDAGATMVLFIFIGLYVARMRSFALGGLIARWRPCFSPSRNRRPRSACCRWC